VSAKKKIRAQQGTCARKKKLRHSKEIISVNEKKLRHSKVSAREKKLRHIKVSEHEKKIRAQQGECARKNWDTAG